MAKQGKAKSPHMWFARAGGRWARAQERRLLRQNLRPIVGDFGAQLGDTQAPHLAYANLRRRFYIDANGGNARADWSALPFADDGLDVVVLPHTLEMCADAPAVLREAARALRPEGQLIIAGFNPLSLLGLGRGLPWRRRWLAIWRLKDWLRLLNLHIVGGAYGAYLPPFGAQQPWRRRLEDAGARWWPACGGVFVLRAVKRRPGARLVGKAEFRLNKKMRLARAGAAASRGLS